jgi:hypothetical protein
MKTQSTQEIIKMLQSIILQLKNTIRIMTYHLHNIPQIRSKPHKLIKPT